MSGVTGLIQRIAAAAVFLVLIVVAIVPARAGGVVFSSWGNAIRGYDPVAYFSQGKPLKGDSNFSHKWRGATWRFASAANRDKFAASPEKYAPQYGGYCAWAVSQGYTASTDPQAWKIVDGKLYLNYSKSVQKQWIEGGIPRLIAAGDANWPKLEAGLE